MRLSGRSRHNDGHCMWRSTVRVSRCMRNRHDYASDFRRCRPSLRLAEPTKGCRKDGTCDRKDSSRGVALRPCTLVRVNGDQCEICAAVVDSGGSYKRTPRRMTCRKRKSMHAADHPHHACSVVGKPLKQVFTPTIAACTACHHPRADGWST